MAEGSDPEVMPSVEVRALGKRAVGDAWPYLESHTATYGEAEPVLLKAIRRKVDMRILGLMFLCYTMQFIDKVLINYAAVMGLKKDLHLKGNDLSNAATSFFIAYLIAEVPNGKVSVAWWTIYVFAHGRQSIFFKKVPAAKWLGLNVVFWGIVTAATAGVKNYTQLVVARVFLGLFEATVGPSLMLISSQWYTKAEQAPRFSSWFLGVGVGQIVGGVISFGFQHIENAPLEGWRIMFIVLGLVTSVIGLMAFFFIPDTPMKAKFLREGEKVSLLRHVSVNQTGIHNSRFRGAQLVEALRDPQIWLMTLIVILVSVSSGVVTTYSSTLIKNFGFSSPNAALLNTPSGLVSIAFTIIVGIGIRRTSNRWAWIVISCIPGVIGGSLISFLPKSNVAGLLIGVYLVNAIVAPLAVVYHWVAANCAGYTKRAFATSLLAAAFSVGNIIGPQTFQAKDAPNYRPATIAVLATQAAAAVMTVVLFGYYVWENKRRDAREAESSSEPAQTADMDSWGGLTDQQNPRFRYVY